MRSAIVCAGRTLQPSPGAWVRAPGDAEQFATLLPYSELCRRKKRAQASHRQELSNLGNAVLGYKQHVSRFQLQVFLEVSRAQHPLQIQHMTFDDAIVNLAE